MSFIYYFIKGPRLYKRFRNEVEQGKAYVPNMFENIGDSVVKCLRFCWSLSYWGAPVIVPIMYRKGAFTVSGLTTMTSYATSIGIILFIAICIRAVGRFSNQDYMSFIRVLYRAQNKYDSANKKALRRYDFEFSHWPVGFTAGNTDLNEKKQKLTQSLSNRPSDRNILDKVGALPCQILSYIAAHSFGIRMVYPGKTSLINALVGPALQMGRTKIIEEMGGLREKIRTEDGNEIDTMFVDRRNNVQVDSNGNTLVVCCEGNSGFYEIGCTVTPLEAGYSVLGWNHPGFSGSSGIPFPSQEQHAIDGVMQYAINELGFQPHQIVLFAWSIGGYTASFASMMYPEIKFVVLDATFDDIMPLALARMPKSLENVIHISIRKYINLHIANQLVKYPGPVTLIRRSKDEMITTVDPTVIASNRGNDLLMTLLKHRYPKIFDEESNPIIRGYLSKTGTQLAIYLSQYNVDNSYCESLIRSYIEENSKSFPCCIEAANREDKIQLALYLTYQHLIDFDATHCVPLPATFFKKPWNL